MANRVPRRPHFVLHWQRVGRIADDRQMAFSLLYLDRTPGLYLIFSDRTAIQYIGIAYSQSLGKRVGQHMQGVRRVGGSFGSDAHLYVAVVEPRAYRQLSPNMLEEIENYLVWAIQPPGNTAKRLTYRGRELLIESTGDDFGLPRFLYVSRIGEVALVGQGEAPDKVQLRAVPAERRQ